MVFLGSLFKWNRRRCILVTYFQCENKTKTRRAVFT